MTNKLKILAIADLHHWEESEIVRIGSLEYDCCCLLGDIPEDAIGAIREQVNKPLFGVLGNHDTYGMLRNSGVEDIDKRAVVVNGVTFAGLGGSHRYKFGEIYPMLTQDESICAAALVPPCDILISHDTAFHAMKRIDEAHCGLKGISRYIKTNKPKLNIFGHYHTNANISYKGSILMCVFRCALISFPQNTMDIIF